MTNTKNPEHPDKPGVVVGVSGGVDSAVSLYLLQEQGYEVAALNLVTSDAGLDKLDDVRSVCDRAGVKLIIADVRNEFEKTIVNDFIQGYLQGRTPNPCILCNPVIKFRVLIEEADRLGYSYVATGHYAKIDRYMPTNRLALVRSAGGIKDQTYFLYRLEQEQLRRIIFPLSEMDKEQTRKISLDYNIKVSGGNNIAAKKESQDNCFVGESGYAEFIRQELEKRGDHDLLQLFAEGPVLDIAGMHIGTHKGLVHYTVGQRKGFAVKSSERLFVIGKIAAENALVVGTYENILSRRLKVADPVFSGMARITSGTRLAARIRYSALALPCTVYPGPGSSLEVIFDDPAAAPAPGQSCVFYQDGMVMAGGYIALPDIGLRC